MDKRNNQDIGSNKEPKKTRSEEYLKQQEYLKKQAYLKLQNKEKIKRSYNTQEVQQSKEKIARRKTIINEKYGRSCGNQSPSTNIQYTKNYSDLYNTPSKANLANNKELKNHNHTKNREDIRYSSNVRNRDNAGNREGIRYSNNERNRDNAGNREDIRYSNNERNRNNARSRNIEGNRKDVRYSNDVESYNDVRNHNDVKSRNHTRNYNDIKRHNYTRDHGNASVQTRKRKNKGNIIVVIIMMLILLLCCGAGYLIYQQKYGLSSKVMSLNKYYGVNSPDSLAIVLNNKKVENEGIIKNNVPYIEYEFLRSNINSRFYWDSDEQKILYTLEDKAISAKLNSLDYTIGDTIQATEEPVIISNNDKIYVALEYVKLFSDIEYSYFSEPNRVVIRSIWDEQTIASTKVDTQVRYRGGVKSDILTQIKQGSTVTVIDVGENWSNVVTQNGIIGYIQNKNLESSKTEIVSRDFKEQVYSNIKVKHPINLVFHQVTSMSGNNQLESVLENTKAVTTIAPTWFFIDNIEGDITSLASKSYVDKAHELGIDVWAVLNDIDGEISSHTDTLEVLRSSKSRRNLIDQVMDAAISCNVDGINVDIEHVSTEAGEHFLQFLRELSIECRRNQLVLSVDNYPPKAYNQHFDYKEQGIVVDYVVIMGYDEHYSQSKVEGPVASIGYVEEGIKEMITMVPPDKVINAIPFYSRLWEIVPKTAEELEAEVGTEDAEYPNKISSTTYGIENAKKVVDEAGAEVSWDEATQLHVATWEKDNVKYKIWVEDEKSIEEKLKLVKSNNLAGAAFWKLTFDSTQVWDTVEDYLKE